MKRDNSKLIQSIKAANSTCINGPAGSGKTFLVKELIQAVSAQNSEAIIYVLGEGTHVEYRNLERVFTFPSDRRRDGIANSVVREMAMESELWQEKGELWVICEEVTSFAMNGLITAFRTNQHPNIHLVLVQQSSLIPRLDIPGGVFNLVVTLYLNGEYDHQEYSIKPGDDKLTPVSIFA
jgi:Cdc6-like AAA superfamily ATPase